MAINKMKKVLISGYFDPLHIGHVDLIKRARELGEYLIVIVNTDEQAILKKGKSFMPEKERMEIMKSLKGVDEVILSIDKDETVCKTIEMVKPDIFANGGDKIYGEIPEQEICEKLGIKIINNLGDKLQSSSVLTSTHKSINIMRYPLDELLDKRSIIQLKIERIEDPSEKERLKKEFKDYTKAIEAYIKKGVCTQEQAEEWHKRLYEANGNVWDLEVNIRKGQIGDMSLEDVGRTAIKIREKNGIRVRIKSEIVEKTGVGYFDCKINHASLPIEKPKDLNT